MASGVQGRYSFDRVPLLLTRQLVAPPWWRTASVQLLERLLALIVHRRDRQHICHHHTRSQDLALTWAHALMCCQVTLPARSWLPVGVLQETPSLP